MKKLLKYLKPFRWYAIASVLLVLASNVLQLILPTYTKNIINEGIRGINGADPDLILDLGVRMLALSAASVIVSILNSYCYSKTAAGYSMGLRKVIYHKVQSLSQSDIDKVGVASLITRTSSDIIKVQDLIVSALSVLITVPVLFVGGCVMAIVISPEMSKAILLIIPVIALLVITVVLIMLPFYEKLQKKLDKLNQVIREKLSGIRVIRAFNRVAYEDGRFETANTDLTKTALKVQRMISFILPVGVLVAFGLISFILSRLTASVDALDPSIPEQYEKINNTIGDFSTFITYLMLVITAVTAASGLFASIPQANISAKRINEVLEMQTDVPETAEPKHIDPAMRGVIEFRDVSFKYPEKLPDPGKKKRRKKKLAQAKAPAQGVLPFGSKEDENKKLREGPAPDTDALTTDIEEARDNISGVSFICRPGEVTAIIGGTGSGKSTLINLIPRMYDATKGEVLVGGVNVKDLTFEELHSGIAFIPQKAFLFSGSVADNLRYGKPDATEEEMDRALYAAQAKNFVDKLENGKESFISQNATNLSGGQKQRIAIARALIKDADICIFDDSFSALDLATDARLRAEIKKNYSHANIILVAQRVGTVIGADRIIVLNKGEVAGIGKHAELMATCEVYREIVETQLDPEEAAV